ncbi:hypothetical protein Patl1_00382 [Pistacia atlantica]|uniref:Uncharacterized protein n=1 Tax=Pistacia atlantica TaxID=434234 RepID=A0ACC1C3T0_9ROSI|nr:hypothetical protein Patl1_00382 [Pistacia atlantica]
MGENTSNNNYLPQNQVFDLSLDVHTQGGSNSLDDDGRLNRTGTVWTASAHIITAGSGILSLAWAIAQLGWLAGPTVMFVFSFVTYYTSILQLAACYRSGDPVNGKRVYTFMSAVRSKLGGVKFMICGLGQYLNLFGVAIGYTIGSSMSMMAIERSNCFHRSRRQESMPYYGSPLLLQSCPSPYSTISLGLGIAKVAETGTFMGSLTGIRIGTVTETQKIWRSFQALGSIAFAYSYSIILTEIQDTIKYPPSEGETMKKASLVSVGVTTLFYMLCACSGYAAFGDLSPGNLLTGFGFYNPYWLLDIANAAIVIHLVGGYQVYCQPLFAFIEKQATARFPDRFWPLTVYFPVEMYIADQRIRKWSTKWLCLQILSFSCLVITIAAAAGSIAGIILVLMSDY